VRERGDVKFWPGIRTEDIEDIKDIEDREDAEVSRRG
jgi:hypothetical protein